MNVQVAENLMKELMAQCGLNDWKFRWSTAEVEFGSCWFARKELVLSRVLTELNTAEKCKDVMLHEIAHALAGAEAGHGATWRAVAQSIGCEAMRCHNAKTSTTMPQPRWLGTCANGRCNARVERRELGRQARNRWACRCGSLLKWTDRRGT